MRVEDFAETLARRLHAELDELTVPGRSWVATRSDLGRRIRRRRARQALAAAAAVGAIAVAAVLASARSHDAGHRLPPPAAPVILRRLASRSFGDGPPPPLAAELAYGAGRLFAVVGGQRQGPLLRLDPVSLRVTGSLRAGWGPGPVYGGGALWAGGPSGTQLWRIDPATLRVSRRIQLRARITGLAFGHGAVWVTACAVSSRGGPCQHRRQRLERIDPRSGKVTGTITLLIKSNSVDVAAGPVILVSSANSVLAIDPRTLAIRQIFHVNCGGCQGATGVAVGPGGLYAVSGSTVVRLSLTTGRIAARSPWLPSISYIGALEAARGALWLSTETGTFRLDPVTLAPTAKVIAANDSLLLTGDTEHALGVGGSVYVSYSGGLARYSGSVSRP